MVDSFEVKSTLKQFRKRTPNKFKISQIFFWLLVCRFVGFSNTFIYIKHTPLSAEEYLASFFNEITCFKRMLLPRLRLSAI